MEEIIIKVISIETIKPSSPTPKSLQKHQLSIIDQSMPPVYMPVVYFYESNPKITNSEKSNHLKKSLSEILSRFYPLAGRHVGNLHVDCNDGGAPFLEAEADCDLSHALPHTDTKVLNKLLPYKIDELQDFCMAAQATSFRCGGLAVGILISHKIADGVSFISFVNAWSAVARNDHSAPPPKFDAATYFPPLADPSVLDPTMALTKEKVTTRIFRFPATTVSLLRERYSGGGVRPSRVAALSAFIWTLFVSAITPDPDKTFTIFHPIDLRTRGVDSPSPLSKYHFGNLIGGSNAKTAAGDGGAEVVLKIRKSVKAVKNGYVAFGVSKEKLMKKVQLGFSSLLGLPLYEADFGWGRPVWVGLSQYRAKNAIFLLDTKNEGEIAAFIQLTKEDMKKFEPYLKLQMLKSNL